MTNRYEEIEKAFPNYFLKLNTIFKNITEDSKLDVKAVHQDYIQSKVKKTKIRLKIFIKNAINLMAKDSNGKKIKNKAPQMIENFTLCFTFT